MQNPNHTVILTIAHKYPVALSCATQPSPVGVGAHRQSRSVV